MQSNPEKSNVCILNLDKEQEFEDLLDLIYSDLIALLDSKYHVQRARSLIDAQRQLNEHHPIAVLVTDPAITLEQNSVLLRQLRNYVQAGGCAIFSCSFSSFITPPAMDEFWKTSWGLEWKFGGYYRTQAHLNRNVPELAKSSLPTQYSQKAVYLANVASNDSVYLASSDSITPKDVAVAFTQIGEGWLGYIGDVNNELDSQTVILSMLEFAASRSTGRYWMRI